MTPGTPITTANASEVRAGDIVAFAEETPGTFGVYAAGVEVEVLDDDLGGLSFNLPDGRSDSWFWCPFADDRRPPTFVFVRRGAK